ncbi:hypothetical protein PybrP1_007909 [[Pythium] brassicae (nom. inval.)]|nr:hypothetical protein PybrP1_007909 [[Pythium] brassicae (nom. inval.)]
MGDVDFKALYQSSLKLTTAIDDLGLPRLEKGLEQLDDASRAFSHQQSGRKRAALGDQPHHAARRGGGGGGGVDKANFLLAAKGIDAEKLSKELQAFELAPEFQPETPLGETDIEGYLTHHHEMIILTAIEDVSRRTMEATHDRMNQAMIDDFEAAKQRLLEDLGGAKHLGIRNYPRVLEHDDRGNVFAVAGSAKRGDAAATGAAAPATGPFGLSGQRRLDLSLAYPPVADAPLRMAQLSVESALTEEMKQYCAVVKELNASRVPTTRSQFGLVRAFEHAVAANVSAAAAGTKSELVLKCWQLLGDMLAGGDAKAARGAAAALHEREFAAARSEDAPALRHRLAFGARVFLETQFRGFVYQTVQKQQLATGGVPDLVATVRAFVRYAQSSRYAAGGSGAGAGAGADRDVNLWALLYYCLRSGGDQEAADLATSASRSGDTAVDAPVLAALKFRAQQKRAYAESSRGTSGSSATPFSAFSKQFPAEYEQLVDRYHRLTSASIDAIAVVDPFERCVVNLLCLGNPNASDARILTTIEDYLWQRLCFVQRAGASVATPDSAYSVARLAKSLQKFGPAHFEAAAGAPGAAAFLYFEVLLVTQEFEQAVHYLAGKGFLLEAVHFALALHHYGLLRTTSAYAMDDSEEDATTLDLARLVRQYVHAFQRTDAPEAAEYVACLADPVAKKELFAELLLETRKFDVLAGYTNSTDGCRTRGVLDRLLRDEPEDEVKELILNAARKAEARGRPHDAFALLKSAGDIEGVLALLNSQLSATLGAPRLERDEWFRLAKDFAEQWMRFPWVQAVANRSARPAALAFQTLLNVSIFLELFEKQQCEDAVRFVDELGVVPTQDGGAQLPVCVDRFLAFDESVRQTFHILLLGYVECLVREAARVKAQTTGELRRAAVRDLRAKAELVVTFAGMIKFRLPAGTLERLNRMEGMIF